MPNTKEDETKWNKLLSKTPGAWSGTPPNPTLRTNGVIQVDKNKLNDAVKYILARHYRITAIDTSPTEEAYIIFINEVQDNA